MTEQKRFSCIQCGACCRNLRVKQADMLLGLAILPEERSFFSPSLIRPMWSTLIMPGKPFKRVLAWQLDADTCPYVTVDSKCSRYDQRPLACRGYPLSCIGGENIEAIAIDVKCPQATSDKLDRTKSILATFGREICTANLKLYTFLHEMVELNPNIYLFDLVSQSWKKLTSERSEAMLTDDIKKSLKAR